MRRFFVLLVSFLVPLFILAPSVFAASFPDVVVSADYYQAVEYFKKTGVVSGYPDGTFRPANPVNRAEALKMILLMAKISAESSSSGIKFSDVRAKDWFYQFVAAAVKLAIVSGNPDGTFAPARQVNKVEFLKMMLLANKIDVSSYAAVSKDIAPDAPKDAWYIPYLGFAKSVGIVYPDKSGLLEPNKALSRAESADIMYKLVILQAGGPTQFYLSRTEAELVALLNFLNIGDLGSAHVSAQNAVTFSKKALEKSPNETLVKAAAKIAEAFQALVKAYIAHVQNDKTQALTFANTAYSLALGAAKEDASVGNLSNQVKALASALIKELT